MTPTGDDPEQALQLIEWLPARPPNMIHRDEPHRAVRDALEPGPSIVVIQGIGGTGKTWLAMDVANSVRGTRLFSTAVWSSSRDAPLTFDDWLRWIARALARADLAALPGDELEPQVAPLLRERSVLLVVDNFESIDVSEQDKILALSQWIAPPSRLLITSRHVDFLERMPAESASPKVIPLGGLCPAEARQLFFAEVDRLGAYTLRLTSERTLRTVYEVTSGHPWAIRLLVAETRKRPLADIIDELRLAPRETLDALFEYSWERLTNGARLTLQAASLLGGPASLGALSAMTGLSAVDVDRTITELQSVSLLEVRGQESEGETLVGLHPLTRGFVHARVQEEAGLAGRLMDRAALHYLQFLGHNGDFQNKVGHHRIERELETILAVRDWCHEGDELTWLLEFGPGLGNFFWVRGYWRERIRSGELARKAAASLGLRWEEGEILSRELGWSHLQLEEFDVAWGYLDQARVLLDEVGHDEELASCWRYLAQIAFRTDDVSVCQKFLGLALDVASNLPYELSRAYAVARTCVDLGYLALKQDDGAGAEREFQQAVDFFGEVGDEIRMAYGLNGLGDTALKNGEMEKADHLYNQSLKTADKFESDPDRVRVLIRLARLHGQTGKRERALQEARNALAISRRLGLLPEAREAASFLDSTEPLRVDLETNRVWVCGVEVHLPPLAVELLAMLKDKEGALASYDDICARLWPGSGATPARKADVQRLVHDIRKAIKPLGAQSTSIQSVAGKGYVLVNFDCVTSH